MNLRIDSNRFLMWWIAGSLLVYPAVGIVASVCVVLLGVTFTMLDLNPSNWNILAQDVLFVVGGIPAVGAIIGFSVGQIQRNLMRRHLYWTADHWRRYSIIGGIVGALLVTAANVLPPYLLDMPGLLLTMPLFVACLSGVQWLSLRKATRSAWLWVLANVAGGVVFIGLITPEIDGFIQGFLAAVAQGAITGIIMLHLFERHSYQPEKTEPKHPADPNRPPSVWDHAI